VPRHEYTSTIKVSLDDATADKHLITDIISQGDAVQIVSFRASDSKRLTHKVIAEKNSCQIVAAIGEKSSACLTNMMRNIKNYKAQHEAETLNMSADSMAAESVEDWEFVLSDSRVRTNLFEVWNNSPW
jgi:hypothetical protein